MDQTVQVARLLVELEEALILQVLLVGLLGRKDHAQAGPHLVAGEALLQPLQIERVLDELIVHINQKLVPLQLTEPLDPAIGLVLQCWVIRKPVNVVLVLVTLAIIVLLLLLHLLLHLLLGLGGSLGLHCSGLLVESTCSCVHLFFLFLIKE